MPGLAATVNRSKYGRFVERMTGLKTPPHCCPYWRPIFEKQWRPDAIERAKSRIAEVGKWKNA